MTYLIIDESGDLGKHGSKYFIILGILIKEEKKLGKIIKTLRRNQFKKKLANVREIKGITCSAKILKQILRKVNKLDAEIYCVIWDKKKKLFPGLRKSKVFSNNENLERNKKNSIYDYIAGLLAEEIEINSSLLVRIDKSKLKYEDIKKFNDFF